MQAGTEALAALRPAQARAAFQRALAMQPGHQEALGGLDRGGALEVQLADLAEGTRAEAAGAYEMRASIIARCSPSTPASRRRNRRWHA